MLFVKEMYANKLQKRLALFLTFTASRVTKTFRKRIVVDFQLRNLHNTRVILCVSLIRECTFLNGEQVKHPHKSNTELLITEYTSTIQSVLLLYFAKCNVRFYLFILVSSDSDELSLDKRVSAKAAVRHLEKIAGAN